MHCTYTSIECGSEKGGAGGVGAGGVGGGGWGDGGNHLFMH